MKIRRELVDDMFKSEALRKAIAMALFVKRTVISSTIPNFSLAKLSKVTGLAPTTAKKRLKTLRDYDLVKQSGKKGQNLIFVKLHSGRNEKNFSFSENGIFERVKDIEIYLRAFLVMAIQSRKDFVKSICEKAWGDEVSTIANRSWARRVWRRYGINGKSFNERGLSYKGIAKKLGISIKTAFETVKYAILRGLIAKKRHIVQLYYPKVGLFAKGASHYIYKNSFVMANNIYFCYANTYTILTN